MLENSQTELSQECQTSIHEKKILWEHAPRDMFFFVSRTILAVILSWVDVIEGQVVIYLI